MDKLKEIIELITRKVIKDNKFLSAVPCKVVKSNEDDSFVVKTFSSGAEYKVYNYSGSKVNVGDNVQVFYQDGLGSQSSYIGCSLYKESVLSINDVILTGNKTSVDIKMPFLIVAGETYVIDGTEIVARTGASIMAIGESKAVGALSLAIGANTIAKGDMSFAAGASSKAVGALSFAIGAGTQAIGQNSVSIGMVTQAIGNYSFAGGTGAIAQGINGFSFGGGTQANGNYSSAVGGGCIANGTDSYAGGCETIAGSNFQTVIGKYNVSDDDDRFAFIIGNGNNTHGVARSNAFAVDWQGNIYINNSATGVNLNNIVSQLSDKISESDITQLRETVSNNATNISKNKNALVRLVDSSWKNLLNPKSAENYSGQSSYPISQSGIDYVLDNTNNKIVISGTANATSVIRIPIALPAGNYHVNGVPVGGSGSTYHANLREQGTDDLIAPDSDYGAGFDISVSNETIADYCIQVESDCMLDNVEFAPMICELVAWNISQTYQPYRPNYQELCTRVLTLENTINS